MAPRPRPGTGVRASLRGLLRDAARVDRTQSDPVVSLRNAVGIAAPLAIGALAGSAALGLAATIGALQTGFADRPGPYLLRMMRMLGVATAAAITSGLAIVFSGSDVASVLFLLVLAAGAGLLLTAGPSATQFGIAATTAALVLGHTPQPPSVAVHLALFVLAGGAGQAVLAVAAWPLGRHRPERTALAALYRDLAGAARVQHGAVAGPPAADTLTTARQTLYGLGHDHGASVEAYRVLLDEADRIRREIVVLTAAVERLADERNPILAGLVRGSLTDAGDVLDGIGAALERGRDVETDVLDRARRSLRHTVGRLESSTHAPAELTRHATAARLRALSGQLRAAVDTASTGASEGGHGDPSSRSGLSGLGDLLAVLRANLTPSSAVLRHALRLGLVVSVTDLVVRLAGVDRGYWVALTLLVVMRPDFGATLQRSLLRVIGTVIGLLVATELVHLIPGGDWYQVVLIGLFAFGMRLAGPNNVALTAVSLSALVVVLLSIEGIAPHDTLVARSVATLVGGALAVLAALVLPAWERQYVPGRLGDLLAAYRRYLAAVADPAAGRDELQTARAAARVARSNAQASVDRALAEPVHGVREVELGRTVLAHTHRLVHGTMTIDAVRRTVREAGGLDPMHGFLTAADATLDALETALRTGRPPDHVDALRPLQGELAENLVDHPDQVGGLETATTVIEATDRITNSLDTLDGELRRQLDPDRDEADAALASDA